MLKPDVWVVWPTVHEEQSQKMIKVWSVLGYKTAVLINSPLQIQADKVIFQDEWRGFPLAINVLCRSVPGNIVVTVGDDVYPDPNQSAEQIGKEFINKFPNLFGVMQPLGDDFGNIRNCAVSPWIGRSFIEQAYGGFGPFYENYYHYFSDGELQDVANLFGVFQQREDVVQYHDNWQRQKDPERPEYLTEARKHWCDDRALYDRRKKAGFPNHRKKAKRTQAQVKAWGNWYTSRDGIIEPRNGVGSSVENTKEIREALPRIFETYEIKIFTDIPCGDWTWMQHTNLAKVKYLGYDVVPEQIKDNSKRFPNIEFQVCDIVKNDIRDCDLVLCRDLLFHLSFEWIFAALENIKKHSRWLLATSFATTKTNKDVKINKGVQWSPINLEEAPFNLPKPVEIIQENNSSACRGRMIGLFDLEKWQ